MSKPSLLTRSALVFTLAAGFACAALLCLSAQAENTNATALPAVVVTGSLIPTADTVGVAPVETVTAADLQKTGSQDVLASLRALSPGFSGNGNVGQSLNNGGYGEAYIALRNLPTLVLIDGQRLNISPFSTFVGTFAPDVNMIPVGMIEKIEDFTHHGESIPASRLGYRITERFIRRYFGRIFDNPDKVFDKSILQPETQDLDSFADGVKYIVEAQQRSAQQYLDDGTIEKACPPLKVLLTIMAHGHCKGKTERDPEVRRLFTREALLASDWYRERLVTKQARDIALWERHRDYLETHLKEHHNADRSIQEAVRNRQQIVASELVRLRRPEYLKELHGTLGAEPRL